MLKMFERCPACGGQLVITECKCVNCQIQIRGEFQPAAPLALSEDQWTFVRVFLRARGNLSEAEKVLGVSYPTIRNKLDEINAALDRAEPPMPTPPDRPSPSQPDIASAEQARRAILQDVAAGKCSATDAARKLRELQGGK